MPIYGVTVYNELSEEYVHYRPTIATTWKELDLHDDKDLSTNHEILSEVWCMPSPLFCFALCTRLKSVVDWGWFRFGNIIYYLSCACFLVLSHPFVIYVVVYYTNNGLRKNDRARNESNRSMTCKVKKSF